MYQKTRGSKMYFLKIIPVIAVSLIFMSCTDKEKQTTEKGNYTMTTTRNEDTVRNKTVSEDTIFKQVVLKEVSVSGNVPKNLHENLSDIFEHYIAIKEELAGNDSIDSRAHAYEMLEVIMKASEDPDNKIDTKWTLVRDKLMQYQKVIEKSVTLKDQREWFSRLSASLTEAIQKYGLPDKTIYELSSLKSVNGKNAKWLTDSKNSEDPYTGKDNDACSVVVERAWEFD